LGISSFPEDGRQPADLIKGADSALYAAKRDGRNVIRTHG
jgi:GGDEF domain-containing protein